MPGAGFEQDSDFDPQDQAETLDDTNFTEAADAGEFRTFEELPEVLDLTQADGDRDDDEALVLDADEFEEEAFSDDDLEEDNELDYRARAADDDDVYDGDDRNDLVDELNVATIESEEIDGLDEVLDADTVSGGEDDFTNFQAKRVSDENLARMGYLEDGEDTVGDGQTSPAAERAPFSKPARGA
jgi:hypothetical protein